ncbi:hypothetical protein, partial [Pseudomonas aeruginosa]|uniref:hypothetical protein n=1 Tax=Pseudomonas aeruginosa TaxID=287 RepID=UPI00397C519F
ERRKKWNQNSHLRRRYSNNTRQNNNSSRVHSKEKGIRRKSSPHNKKGQLRPKISLTSRLKAECLLGKKLPMKPQSSKLHKGRM